jgi:hypothetical protein
LICILHPSPFQITILNHAILFWLCLRLQAAGSARSSFW